MTQQSDPSAPVLPSTNGTSPTALGVEEREPFLKELLELFEHGQIDAHEYSQNVNALERAASVDEMAAIVETQAGNVGGGPSAHNPGTRARPALDPVDLARLAAGASTPRAAANHRALYVTLGLVVLMLVVAVVMGIWLVSRAHGSTGSSQGIPAALRHLALRYL